MQTKQNPGSKLKIPVLLMSVALHSGWWLGKGSGEGRMTYVGGKIRSLCFFFYCCGVRHLQWMDSTRTKRNGVSVIMLLQAQISTDYFPESFKSEHPINHTNIKNWNVYTFMLSHPQMASSGDALRAISNLKPSRKSVFFRKLFEVYEAWIILCLMIFRFWFIYLLWNL